ncbi:flagellar assembly peptidoglycan hydrolase FlgJ [Candidatus Symbiobacter mobilis]|uniref:Peptidoglycan hydrolase FlgJ n=1 Tax=Candidatus Symbiobacter mobilis CR TaxID=946483 RepID=U5NB09_9BURK|nr:flagellar assembly peptidoglycan hydrolase FlgJ [Candidatus Symbiobacter mobilis]AGX87413.1 flagellar protein FlgJ [Candidatus Symbiobacter mobilis CR]
MSLDSLSSYSPYSSASAGLAADIHSLDALKRNTGQATPESIRETARQFESLFMRELIKSMREATASMKSDMFDSPTGNMATDMLDQQFSVQMSGQPGGLSDLIAAQLSKQAGLQPESFEKTPPSQTDTPLLRRNSSIAAYRANQTQPPTQPTTRQTDFVQLHTETAARIEKDTGIPASYMVGQAALETGWGQRQIKARDGSLSHNLFGIKAGPGWKGKVAEVTTTEYVNGVATRKVAKFRAYGSYEESFRDYARLITKSPRYAKVNLQDGSAHSFATSLQRAGYATDPQYATKLRRTIEATQRLQRGTQVAAQSV